MSILHRDFLHNRILTKARAAPRRRTATEARVRAVLMELMCESESDSVRVAAAKALLDKILKDEEEGEGAQRHEDQEHAAALAEARALLSELADAKSGGVGEPGAVDPKRSPRATDA